jgi:hypothetical protein
MHPPYDRSPLCGAVFLLVCCLRPCMLAGWCICDIVDIAVGRFGCLCVFGTQGVSVMPLIWLL